MKNFASSVFFFLTLSLMGSSVFAGPQEDLWRAIRNRNLEQVKKVLDRRYFLNRIAPAQVNVPFSSSSTPLSLALALTEREIAQELINRGADVNQSNQYGSNLLHLELVFNQIENARFLIRNGADVNQVDQHGMTPFDTARATGDVDEAQILELIELAAQVAEDSNYGPMK